ncbi:MULTISPECIES: phosphoglycerate transporter protein PgtP [Apibacter]|uniref:phosphoglycerate transporter protein PgtP n=1 Tax=Apibacter TaxID=1778601 RepID=UPI00132BE84B|nr:MULTISPECIES: phosphoglycerate transporter protein PgtP [Apibacter]MCX8677810.1 MFS transporter [Apibacter sp. B3919]MXO25086.1 MFS transporter [Apibacter sp. B3924]MXO27163.1 MFS transporter [Apibacter sp. B3813]MXO28976.1 MFS transporter [Apibacter sp. B3913]MXO31243.1 MFS transporter [Apibacter sp. B3912]
MSNFLAPPKPIERKPESEVKSSYTQLRLQVFIGIFIGYAAYYLVRKNFSLAMPYLVEMGFSKSDLGIAFSFNATAYGLSKFIMGGISDRSNARKFLPLGLILAAVSTIIAGTSIGMYNITVMAVFQFLVGWFGGMGWPPCGRVMTHWFSVKERGTKMAIWNLAHNVGGGLLGQVTKWGILFASSLSMSVLSWKVGMFWFPAGIAILIAIISYILIRDNPQACGLPSIEEYKNDFPPNYSKDSEKVLSTKEIFFKYVLNNKMLWFVAFANAFVYFIRYGVQDWAPTYLSEVKGYSQSDISNAYTYYELAAIPGTLLCGWVSDKIFKGKRAMTTIIFMLLVIVSIVVYWQNPDSKLVDLIALTSIGFFIYGPVMLIGVQALDLAPKNAAGTAAGLTGFFGYFIGTSLLANIVMGKVVESLGWSASFQLLIGSGILSIIFMAFTYKKEQELDKNK